MKHRCAGFSLVELLVAVAIVGILAAIAVVHAGADHDRLLLESAARRLQLGLERARVSARRDQQACGISLTGNGWSTSPQELASQTLRPCSAGSLVLHEPGVQASVALHTNLPAVVRVSANGLLLDGGTTVLSHPRVATSRCLVLSLPLGISRIGVYSETLPAAGARLRSSRCRPLQRGG